MSDEMAGHKCGKHFFWTDRYIPESLMLLLFFDDKCQRHYRLAAPSRILYHIEKILNFISKTFFYDVRE